MPSVIRTLIDDAQFHGYLPLAVVTTGSTKVFTNGSPTARVGDPYTPTHCLVTAPPVCHPVGQATEGSPDVFVEGIPVHREGDRITCGAVADNGSPNVFANGVPPQSQVALLAGESGSLNTEFIGYVVGKPVVEYLDSEGIPVKIQTDPIIQEYPQGPIETINFDILPFDGFQNSAYVRIHEENNANPYDIGEEAGRTYPGIGVYPPNPDLPGFFSESPPQITYEHLTNGAATVSFDNTTGRLVGSIRTNQSYTVWVRATHYYFDDTGDDVTGIPGPWWVLEFN